MDVLSDVLRAIRLTGAVYFDINAGYPWIGESPGSNEISAAVMPSAEHVISFHAVVAGSCWAALSDGSAHPVHLQEGDVVMFPGGAPNVMSSTMGARDKPNMAMYYRPIDQQLPFTLVHGGDGNERTRFVCGYVGCDVRPFNPLLAALPPLIVVSRPPDEDNWIIDILRVTLTEGSSQRPGGETILAKLSELMFVEVLRRYVATLPEETRGWLSGLRDGHVGEALRLLHSRPAQAWTLDRLAQAVGLSRTIFVDRFTHYVEIPPMQYLTRWRLQLAARLLERPSTSIAQAAAEVGYESEAAFNRAFKKFAGRPPGAWRKGLPS
jgi:AraC-like DNA-binding protein